MDPVKWFNISNGFAIFGALLTLSGIIGIWHFGNINAKNTDIEIQDRKTEAAKANAEVAKANKKVALLELDIAKANKETESAKAIAESAKLKTSELNLKVEEAHLQAENAKIERENLKQQSLLIERENQKLKDNIVIEKQERYEAESRIKPRGINQSREVSEPLMKFKNIKFEVYYVDSGEPHSVAGQLTTLLKFFCYWEFVIMEPITSLGTFDGITIESNVGGTKDETGSAASELKKQLILMGLQAKKMPAHPELPINTLKIVIGHKPKAKKDTEPNNDYK